MSLFLFHAEFKSTIYELFCLRLVFFVCGKPSQPGSIACREAELGGSGPRLSHRPPEHDVQYGYYQRVALLIV